MILINPNKIYKSLSCKKHAKNLNNGNLLLRSIEYYKSYPKSWEYSEKISDYDEFTVRLSDYISSKIFLASEAMFIFSSHDLAPIGEYYVIEIIKPDKFFHKIKDSLGSFLYCPNSLWSCGFGKVLYYEENETKENIIKNLFIINPLLNVNDYNMDYPYYGLLKNKQFERQNEIRMWFQVDLNKLPALHQCSFFERKIDLSCNKWIDSPICFSEWYEKKRDCKNDNNNYWVQVELKNIGSFFKNYSEKLTISKII